jgi:hypothetical protein
MTESNDVYADFSPPKYLGLVGSIIGIGAFCAVAALSNSSAPFFAAMSVAVITMLIGLTWPLRARPLLWVLMALIALIHIAALLLIPFPEKVSYGLLFAPLFGLEIFALWRGTIGILKMADPHYRR